MRRSLLDGADLARLRAAGDEGGPAGLVLACLLEAGVVAHDPADPEWADRDRLLVDPGLPLVAVAAAAHRAAYPLEEGRFGQGAGRVAADALRAAQASMAAGEPYRVFLLLAAGALAEGRVWESVVAAGSGTSPVLIALVLEDDAGRLPDAAAALAAAGWRVLESRAEAAQLLGALDHALATPAGRWQGPVAVVVRSG